MEDNLEINLIITNKELSDKIIETADSSFRTIELQVQYILNRWLVENSFKEEISTTEDKAEEPEPEMNGPILTREQAESRGLLR